MKLAAVVLWGAAAWAQTVTVRTVADGLEFANAVALDAVGDLYIGSWLGPIWKVTAGGEVRVAIADRPPFVPSFLTAIAVDRDGVVYGPDSFANRVWRYDGRWSAAAEGLNKPEAVAVDGAGNLYIADTGNRRVLLMRRDGSAATVAGGVKATGLAVDGAGYLYVVDYPLGIRKIAPDGTVSTVAETLEGKAPMSVAAGRDGSVYFGESGRVRAASGRTVFQEEGFTAQAMAVDAWGDLYVADVVNGRVRKVEFYE